MHVLSKPFLTLTAADVMTRDVVVIPERMSLRTAATLLARARVSGAPVVDAAGACVGVLSNTDFVRWARGEAPRQAPRFTTCVCSEWQVIEVDSLPTDEVAAYMTADPVTAPAHTGVIALARMMLDAHIHRVIIVDGHERPVGVVSSTDVLAAVANADLGE
jgi:CBS-domain-containing membrane protein